MDVQGPPERIRLSKVIGGLSYALDVTEGEPPGHAVRSCVIGMRIAHELGLDAASRSHLFYALLMKDAGCTANSAKMAALFGAGDHEAKRTAKRTNWSRAFPAFVWSLRVVAPGGSLRARVARLKAIKDEGQVTRSLMLARCDRGAEIALLLGLDRDTAEAIRALDEHWDGNGQPRGLRGDEIPLLARIVCLAQTAEIFHGEGGPDAACAAAARRSGEWFDPEVVAALRACRDDSRFWWSLTRADVSAWEPEERMLTADDVHLDRIATAFAGVIDVKSPWTYRHSDLVAMLAVRVAAALGADEAELTDLRRAAMLHDIGKLAVSNRILDKAGRLTEEEFAQVREHPLVTAQIMGAHPRVRPPRAAGRRAPRAARRQRLSVRPARREAHDADARARGGRRLRGDHVGAPVPAGEGRRDRARHPPRRRARAAGRRRGRGARAGARPARGRRVRPRTAGGRAVADRVRDLGARGTPAVSF
jgi:putative nucleotidyltransferase with HDIG domain